MKDNSIRSLLACYHVIPHDRKVTCLLFTVYIHYDIYVKLVSKEPKSHNSGFCIVSHSRIANCEKRLSWMLIPQVLLEVDTVGFTFLSFWTRAFGSSDVLNDAYGSRL